MGIGPTMARDPREAHAEREALAEQETAEPPTAGEVARRPPEAAGSPSRKQELGWGDTPVRASAPHAKTSSCSGSAFLGSRMLPFILLGFVNPIGMETRFEQPRRP